MHLSLPILFLINLFVAFSIQKKEQRVQMITGSAQVTTYHITYIQHAETVTKNQVDSILDKIDSSRSLYKSYSLINRFNNSSSGCEVDDHFIKVVKKSLETFKQTDGAFDITVKPLVQAWEFGVNAENSIPDSGNIITIKNALVHKC